MTHLTITVLQNDSGTNLHNLFLLLLLLFPIIKEITDSHITVVQHNGTHLSIFLKSIF